MRHWIDNQPKRLLFSPEKKWGATLSKGEVVRWKMKMKIEIEMGIKMKLNFYLNQKIMNKIWVSVWKSTLIFYWFGEWKKTNQNRIEYIGQKVYLFGTPGRVLSLCWTLLTDGHFQTIVFLKAVLYWIWSSYWFFVISINRKQWLVLIRRQWCSGIGTGIAG